MTIKKMIFKRYIATLLAVSSGMLLPAFLAIPCGGPNDLGYYSSPYRLEKNLTDEEEGDRPGYDETLDFWYAYAEGNVARKDIRDFFDKVEDGDNLYKYALVKYLDSKGDHAALEYIGNCLELNRLVKNYSGDLWNYEVPSPMDIRNFIAKIEKVKTNDIFTPRYEFLKIRGYGAIKDDEGVEKIWKKNRDKKMSDALRDRMLGYVGGVLYRQGKYPEALEYFIKGGDSNSIQWCVEKLAGSDNLIKLYNYNPNSEAIPYILQDYINYLIAESQAGRRTDANEDFSVYDSDIRDMLGKRIYDVYGQRDEMISLCKRALSENKTNCPLIWAASEGVVETIAGDPALGLSTLRKAKEMDGPKKYKDNLRNFTLWALMLNSGRGDNAIDREFAEDMKVFYAGVVKDAKAYMKDYSKAVRQTKDYSGLTGGDYGFLTNFLYKEAVAHYYSLNQPVRAMAFLTMLDDLPTVNYGNPFLAELRNLMDKEKPIGDVYAFMSFIGDDSLSNPIDLMLKPYAAKYNNLANDVAGTRLMRDGKFSKALTYLSEVDPRWARTQPIGPYLTLCYPNPDYYSFSRNRTIDLDYMRSHINYKAMFCADLIDNIQEYEKLSGDEKALKALEIAAMCHFASPKGDGWAISDYSWSVSTPENEFSKMMGNWLDKALASAEKRSTKMLINYAILTAPSVKGQYDEAYAFGRKSSYGSDRSDYFIDSPTEAQKRAMSFIKSNWNMDNLPYHIGQCDVLQAYVTGNLISKPGNY